MTTPSGPYGQQIQPGTLSRQRLDALIAQAGGWLSFEKFMNSALYDPTFGYYAGQIRTVGARGDFTTSPQQSSLLGRALAKWLATQKRRLGYSWTWHVIEVGGGSGALALSVLQALGTIGRLGLRYHLVEISRPLREKQQKLLLGYPVSWHETMPAALAKAQGQALIFSNELVDAFPCRRMQWREDRWHEVGLSLEDGKLTEISRILSPEEAASSSSFALQNGTVDIHSSYRSELDKWAAALSRGLVLTIDYGDRFPQVYHRQPAGTVRGYVHHLRRDGMELYEFFGQQDLTADVNFTDLENWGHELGWANESFATQREFITAQLGRISPKTTVEAKLLDPVGAGGAFKVLQQSYGLND